MPPRTPEETATRRIHNLIGLFAVSVFFFFITWLADRSSPSHGAPLLLWLFGLMGGLSLAGWIVLSAQRVARIEKLAK
jgi:lipid-A-disaccharide synthase-like uncharacterized protein